MTEIPLTKGHVTRVDDADAERLKGLKCCAAIDSKSGKAYAKVASPDRGPVLMHRYLLGIADPKIKVDHKDTDGLNNQRHNLRVATNAQNLQNQGPRRGKAIKYKGVGRNKTKYYASIHAAGRRIDLGYFDAAEEAARAYDAAALIHHGEFARLNFPLLLTGMRADLGLG